MSIHLTDAQRQCIDVLLQRTARRFQDLFLRCEIGSPFFDLGLRIRDPEGARDAKPAVEESGADHECQEKEAQTYAARGQAQLCEVPAIL